MRLLVGALLLAATMLCVWGIVASPKNEAAWGSVVGVRPALRRIPSRDDDKYDVINSPIQGNVRTEEEIDAERRFNQKWVAGGSLFSKVRVWNSSYPVGVTPVRLLCVLPVVGTNDAKLIASYRHWARRCDDVVVMGHRGVAGVPSRHQMVFDVPFHEGLFHYFTSASIALRERVEASDFVVFASLDVFVVVDNVRYILGIAPLRRMVEMGIPMTLGLRFVTKDRLVIVQREFVALSKGTMRILSRIAPSPFCGPQYPREPLDLQLGKCLEAFGIYALDLRDEYGEPVLTYIPEDSLIHRAAHPEDLEDWVKVFLRRKYPVGAASLSQRAVTLMGSLPALDVLFANQTVRW